MLNMMNKWWKWWIACCIMGVSMGVWTVWIDNPFATYITVVGVGLMGFVFGVAGKEAAMGDEQDDREDA